MPPVGTEEKWKKATFFHLHNPGKVIKKTQEFDKKYRTQFID